MHLVDPFLVALRSGLTVSQRVVRREASPARAWFSAWFGWFTFVAFASGHIGVSSGPTLGPGTMSDGNRLVEMGFFEIPDYLRFFSDESLL